ncbi:TIGR01777 family oxidoreductase [Paenibacillus sp. chi10]|uniref:TIGR01777 family oxidoreductase n=1 Tax=Paenibacillus suaedae TaxID=3077233 RepID=A0AAJ2JQM9_9BACL|nr:TIGR01777 family oxidoreductase [Paenibacillus sp. chi10]MDT8974966.1 TIGR01777 family oxidoreductase [Paenibacillus sp. chi10]
MKVMICGGTGLIGRALVDFWLQEGHELIVVTRSPAKLHAYEGGSSIHAISWSELAHCPEHCHNVDAVVNLAGETINQRWTNIARNRILSSRIVPARRIAVWAGKLSRKLPIYISASGISIYGSSETGTFDEMSNAGGDDFLTDVIYQWEDAADRVPAARCVKLRIAPVLANEGGAYPMMKLPYLLGVGGRIGSGKQPLSWIHIADMVRLIDFVLQDSIEGVVNASSPESVTNDDFGRTLARVYHRRHWMPVPAIAFKFLFGEMSSLLLEGQRVYPAKALEHGFTFHYGTLEKALTELRNSGRNRTTSR